jgi:hypothetical protein
MEIFWENKCYFMKINTTNCSAKQVILCARGRTCSNKGLSVTDGGQNRPVTPMEGGGKPN